MLSRLRALADLDLSTDPDFVPPWAQRTPAWQRGELPDVCSDARAPQANCVSAQCVHALSGLSALTHLALDSDHLGSEGTRELEFLSSLVNLKLSYTCAGTDDSYPFGVDGLRAVASLGALTSLHLYDNRLSDHALEPLTSLTALANLSLCADYLQVPSALASLTGLTCLCLDANYIDAAGPQVLAGLVALASLEVNCNRLADAGAAALSSLTSLTTLMMEENYVGDVGACALASMISLVELNLSMNMVGDVGACALTTLTNLTFLGLRPEDGFVPVGAEGTLALASLTALTLGDALYLTK